MVRFIWRFNSFNTPLEALASPVPAVREALNLPDFVRITPVFPGNRYELQARIEVTSESFRAPVVNDLVRYYQAYVPDDAGPAVWEALSRARSTGLVDWFDLQAAVGPPTRFPSAPGPLLGQCQDDPGPTGPTRPFENCQGYLNVPDFVAGRRQGVGARHAWTRRGGQGDAVRLVDLDTGWNLSHEEFLGRGVTPFGTVVDDFHGTSVLGILWGNPYDGVGVTGIVPESAIGLAPFSTVLGQEPNPEAMIAAVAEQSDRGDVLLIEVKALRLTKPEGGRALELPLEAFPLGQAAINIAAEAGMYVVEIAGNGQLDLGADLGVPSSGPALMVGAGHPRTGQALHFSNIGDRVDLQGWGQEVVTTGSHTAGFDDLQRRHDANACYTRSFDGTSSAAAIVAGCVAAISSILQTHGVDLPSPGELRSLLQSTGTFKDRAQNLNIGPLPNLPATLTKLEERLGITFDPA
jgi:hypothetical protein